MTWQDDFKGHTRGKYITTGKVVFTLGEVECHDEDYPTCPECKREIDLSKPEWRVLGAISDEWEKAQKEYLDMKCNNQRYYEGFLDGLDIAIQIVEKEFAGNS